MHITVYCRSKESIHLVQNQVLKIEGARGKVHSVDHVDVYGGSYMAAEAYYLDQLNGWFGAFPNFHLTPLSFEYLARRKCILSYAGDCIKGGCRKSCNV